MSAGKWAEWPVLAFDTETTGVDAAEDRIVTAALVYVEPGKRPVEKKYVVDPGIDIPAEAAAVHNYTRERAIAEATHTPEQMVFELTMFLARWMGKGQPTVIYNAPFDLTLLEAENRRHGVDTLLTRLGRGKVGPIVDPSVLAKYADPKRMVTVKDEHNQLVYREGSKAAVKECRDCRCGAVDWTLTSTCRHYGVTLPGAHGAAADAIAAARLWPKIMTAHAKKFPGHTIGSLHQAQVGWAKDQADKLRGIFNWIGVDDHDTCPEPKNHQCVCPEWPFHDACLRVGAGVR